MRGIAKLLGILVISGSGLAQAQASVQVIPFSVPALEGRTCAAYLHLPETGPLPGVPLAFAEAGTGIYSTSSPNEVPLGLQLLIASEKLAVLTLDKPGILPVPTPQNPGAAGIDAQVYEKYSTPDLVECASHALDWAFTRPEITPQAEIFLLGHSEGSLVVVRLYEKLLQKNSRMGQRVKALILSGAPLDPMREVVSQQVEKQPASFQKKFWKAYQTQDDSWFLQPAHGGVGYTWFKEAWRAAPLTQTLDHLAKLKATAHFEFYQGLKDENVKASALQVYESRNQRNERSTKSQAIRLDAHYYTADHNLNRAAYTDILGFLQSCFEPGLPFCM